MSSIGLGVHLHATGDAFVPDGQIRDNAYMSTWQRFWCPIDGSYSLADGGFLVDPEGEHSSIYQPDAVAFASIAHLPVLALLGEPGIGKSTAIKSVADALKTECATTSENFLAIDLCEYGSEDRLERHIVESDQFQRWSNKDGVLHLVLDSLDECRIRIPNVAALLLGLFRAHSTVLPRLRLRIACRTADWPSQLTAGLRELWGSDDFAVYELLPLRRQDVADAARSAGIDEDEFITAVHKANAQPLAIKPITLRFLIDLFEIGKGLPATQTALYESGCRRLCTESSASRRDAGHLGSLDPDQRLAVASRVAALMTLCRKTMIAVDSLGEVQSPDIMPLTAATGGTEPVKGNYLAVTEAELREVLATGLFSGRGTGLLGFAHQTYAEYLAARYLATHSLDLTQMSSLVCHPGDITRPVVPQLAELAGWLASMSRQVFRHLMTTDPVVLLRSDAATADNADRAALIEAVLQKLDDVEVDDREWSLRERCARFMHPGLVAQLQPYIVDKTKDVVARRAAIDIAEAGELDDLQDTLVAVALDTSDVHHIRDQAAHAIAEIGDDAHRRQILPLVTADEAEDPDDQLRGCAMRALWSRRLIALDDLLAAIRSPRRQSFMGSYDLFMVQDFVTQLTPDEIPRVLDWLCNHHEDDPDDSSVGLRRLSDSVVSLAVERLDDASTRVALAKYALQKLEERDSVYSSLADDAEPKKLREDRDRRRKLVHEIVRQMNSVEKDAAFLVRSPSALVTNDDLRWLLDQAIGASESQLAQRYAHLARYVFSIQAAADIECIIDAAGRSPAIYSVFEPFLCPIELGSEKADDLRQKHKAHQDMMSRRREPEPVDPPMTEHVKTWLGRCELGEVDAWWQLNHCMLFDKSGQAGGRNDLEDDLRELPGWKDASPDTRHRIVEAAKVALRDCEPNNSTWLGTNTLHRPACAGYRALVLLAHEEPEALRGLPAAIWAKWAASVLGFPVSVGIVGNEQPALDLAAMTYANAPEATIDALLAIIDKENGQDEHGHLFILRKMQNCWDDCLCCAMLEKAKDANLKPSCVGDLLKELLERGCAEAKAFAQSFVTVPVPTEENERLLAREAAIALIEHADDAGWPVVWPACTADQQFGRSILEAIAQWDRRNGGLTGQLTEDQLAALYVWLAREYPHSEDPRHDGAHCVDRREAVAHFRDGVLRAIEERGTVGAVSAIRKIAGELPNLGWLRYTLVSAKHRMLRQSWLPPLPEEVLRLCAKPSSRLVRTASELQDVLLEVFEEIDQELQGETPAAPEVWNLPTSRTDKTPIRPKDENRFSDWLKLRLDAKFNGRGIVSLREVEIRRGEGVGDTRSPGERTDIHVTGLMPEASEGTFDTARVVVEVKGCWHSEVQTAMETQLVNRYLADNACQHGIYLVGWYMCGQWDDSDQRKSATPGWTIDQARQYLDQQASGLCTSQRRIRAFVLNAALR